MASKPQVSIVIPNYNEEQNIKRGVLGQVASYLSKAKFTYEVIISDDGSSDSSLDLALAFARKHPHFRVLKNPHGGKAAAVYAGIKAAQGEVVLFTDMDQSTPLKEIEKLLPWYDRGYQVVFGSRGKARKNFLGTASSPPGAFVLSVRSSCFVTSPTLNAASSPSRPK